MTLARTVSVVLLPALVASWAPGRARADCPTDRAAERIFHPYGEPAKPCPEGTERGLDKEKEDVLADDRGQRRLQSIGISGMEGGASLAGLGGFLLLLSLMLDDSGRAHRVLSWTGIAAAATGGAAFVAGGVLLGVDAMTSPAPTPDRRGAQLVVAFRF